MMKQKMLAVVIVLATITALLSSTYAAYASTVDVPDPVLERDPPSTNASERVQMTIRPGDIIPPNGTVTMSMEGMNDVDFKDTVPAGVTVIIDNQSATVTNQPVQAPGVASTAETPTPAPAAAPETEEEPEEEEE